MMLVIHYQNCLSQVKLLISCKTDEQMRCIVICKYILLRLLKTSEVVVCNFPKNKNFHGNGAVAGYHFETEFSSHYWKKSTWLLQNTFIQQTYTLSEILTFFKQ